MKRRAGKFTKQVCRVSSAGIQHSIVESTRHQNDKRWALKERRQVKCKLSGNKLGDRAKVLKRIKATDNRLSHWANEHIGKASGEAVKWSGWEMRLTPRVPLRDILKVPQMQPQTPQMGPAMSTEGTAGQQVMAAAVEPAIPAAPLMLVMPMLMLTQSVDLMPVGEGDPEHGEVIPVATKTLEHGRSQEKAQSTSTGKPQGTGAPEMENGDQDEGPDVDIKDTPGTEPGNTLGGFANLASLLDDEEDEEPIVVANDVRPPPIR